VRQSAPQDRSTKGDSGVHLRTLAALFRPLNALVAGREAGRVTSIEHLTRRYGNSAGIIANLAPPSIGAGTPRVRGKEIS